MPQTDRQIDIFQEGTPRRTDISVIGLAGCFRTKLLQYTATCKTLFFKKIKLFGSCQINSRRKEAKYKKTATIYDDI